MRNLALSASKVALAMTCPTSAILPRGEFRTDSRDKASGAGNYRHAFLAAIPKFGVKAALEAAPEAMRGELGAINLDALPIKEGAMLSTEIGFGYNVLTGSGRELTARGDNGYVGVHPGEIPGTADVFGITADGKSVIIIDWKTPWADVPAARENWQLITLALASTKALKIPEATVAICRIRDDGEPYFDIATFDAFDLDSFGDELRKLWPRLEAADREYEAGREPPVSMGSHCSWCQGVAHCRAQKGLVRAAAGLPVEELEASMVPTSPEAAVAAWVKIGLITKACEMAEKGIRAYARSHPLTLPDGKVLGLVETSSESIDEIAAQEFLVDIYGEEIAKKMVKISVSKDQIKKVIQDHVLPPLKAQRKTTLKSIVEPLHDAMRASGIMTKRTYAVVKVHKAGQRSIESEE